MGGREQQPVSMLVDALLPCASIWCWGLHNICFQQAEYCTLPVISRLMMVQPMYHPVKPSLSMCGGGAAEDKLCRALAVTGVGLASDDSMQPRPGSIQGSQSGGH